MPRGIRAVPPLDAFTLALRGRRRMRQLPPSRREAGRRPLELFAARSLSSLTHTHLLPLFTPHHLSASSTPFPLRVLLTACESRRSRAVKGASAKPRCPEAAFAGGGTGFLDFTLSEHRQ